MNTPATPMNPMSKVPQNFLRCPVCLAQYDITRALRKPIMLECHHSACRICVSSLISRLPRRLSSGEESFMSNPRALNCPICRARTRIPINGVNSLQENFYIVSILENMQNQNSTPIAISENSGDNSGESALSALKMWCDSCRKVATTECESHTLKKVSEALLELEETLNQNLNRANGNLMAQVEIVLEGLSSTDLQVKIDRLQNCLNLLPSLIQNKIANLQFTKDWKQGSEVTISRLKQELQEIETRKNSANMSPDETSPGGPDRQHLVSRRYENMLEHLHKLSEMVRTTDDIILTIISLLTPQPEERRQSLSEQFAHVVADLTRAFDL